MSKNDDKEQINYLVKYLDLNNRPRLTEIEKKYEGINAGTDTSIYKSIEQNSEEERYKYELELSHASLFDISKRTENVLIKLKSKLKCLNNTQLISQLIVIVSGATILTTIENELKDEYFWLIYIAPSLVLIASLLTIWAKNKSESFLSGNKNLYESTGNLISLKNQSIFLLKEIEVLQKYFHLESAKAVITQANDTAKQMLDEMEKQ